MQSKVGVFEEVQPVESNDPNSEAQDVCRELGELNEGALIFEAGLAQMLGKHVVSIKRAVERGELPPPTRLMGKLVWTAGVIRRHIEDRLAAEARYRAKMDEGVRRHLT